MQTLATYLKASFMCPKAYRQQFSQSQAQLTISVGQPVHEGERLQQVVHLVNQSFARCLIMIDDSIQWYTLAISHPQVATEQLIQTAIQAGDDYLMRNQIIFNKYLTIPYQIMRWRDWHHTPAWQRAVENMHQAYHHYPLLQQAIRSNVSTFLARYERNRVLTQYNREQAVHLCTQYLLEECAVMRYFWISLGSHFEVYPSRRNEAMTATHQLFIAPSYPHLLLPVAIRFNRRRRVHPEIPLIPQEC